MQEPAPSLRLEPASLVVVDPNGGRKRINLAPIPFQIGRSPGNELILRDSRVSRTHARIVACDGGYVLEDAGSRHGTFVNGARVTRHELRNGDIVEFGGPESYSLTFVIDGAELKRLIGAAGEPPPGVGGGLAKVRAMLELARTVQSSLSINDVLASVVEAALAVTGAERGFLLLRSGESLECRVARHRDGSALADDDLRVPRGVIRGALEHRRELLYMNFDPAEAEVRPLGTIADLDLRSVICVPLVRIGTGRSDSTGILSTANESVGVLYLDSRATEADLAGGNRELVQALAIEASTVLENARLLEEEDARRRLEDELRVAQSIQQNLLPRCLPDSGWLRAAGSSAPSRQVGGDYFDLAQIGPDCWSAVVADVSGKGVSAALLASLLQGALITVTENPSGLGTRLERVNRFLIERTGGEKYATIFYCLLDRGGRLSYVNAAHCPPVVLKAAGDQRALDATGMPVGLIDTAEFDVADVLLSAGDKVVVYSDGVTEAQNAAGEFFGRKRLREVLGAHAGACCAALHDAIQSAVTSFTEGAPLTDDVTLLVMEYQPTDA